MLHENVVKLLKESMWDLATCADGEPNIVPVAGNHSWGRVQHRFVPVPMQDKCHS